MSTLYWLRVARRAKLYKQPEYPNIEALLEAEADQTSDDFRVAAKYAPPAIAIVGTVASIIGVFAGHSLMYLLMTVFFGLIATLLWFVFDHLDKKIPPSRVLVRKRAKEIAQRVCGFSNIVGMDPALSPAIGVILDEAAGIYLKHQAAQEGPFADNRSRAAVALEEGMGKLMELASLPTVRAQELELQRGWAQPLLQEMRDLDRVLDEHMPASLGNPTQADDPLAQLRQARYELQGIDNAISELEQNQGQ